MDIKNICFCFDYDDGKILDNLDNADVIILGPSRVGKTPLCFYLGYFGINACNIPLVPEVDIDEILKKLPRKKTFGLIRDVQSIKKLRSNREEYLGLKSNYSTDERILEELLYSENIYKSLSIPVINLDNCAIEEAYYFISKRIAK